MMNEYENVIIKYLMILDAAGALGGFKKGADDRAHSHHSRSPLFQRPDSIVKDPCGKLDLQLMHTINSKLCYTISDTYKGTHLKQTKRL
jgi:hypothetical protein